MTGTVDRTRTVVVVTGDSSGIGRACCERLAASGRIVHGASRTEPAGAKWHHMHMDVTDEASVRAAVTAVLAREGRLDAVIHCAGVSLAGPFEDTSIEEAHHHLDVNYMGAVRVLRAALPVMRKQQAGKLVVIGSIGGLIGLPYLGHYSSAKFALDGLVESLRHELAPFGVEATVVHPGDFKTDLSTRGAVSAATTPASPYDTAFRRALAYYHKAEAEARSPAILAARIDALLDRRRLPPKVIVGTAMEVAGVVLKRTLPARLFERILAQSYSR